MTDIVERLGQKARGERNLVGDLWGDWLCDEAASEIRRLRRIVDGTREWAAVTDARLVEAVEVGDTLRAAIAYALSDYADDGLIFLSEWSEGNPDAMAELDRWRAKLEGRSGE